MKALFTYDYGKENMDRIRALGYEVMVVGETVIENNPQINQVEVLVCYSPFKRLDVGQMKQLRFIQLSSTGIDQLPDNLDRDVQVANNRGGYSVPMGEWTVMRLLELYKDADYFFTQQKNRKWAINTSIQELAGKRVAFLGTGTVATEGARRLAGFDMTIHGFSLSGAPKDCFERVFPMDAAEDLIGGYDAVVIALPHTEKTHHLVSEKFLGRMKDQAVLINVSRGKVLDERALLLHAPRFKGIALDVFEEEPLKKDSPLWEVPNLLISPHNSWVSQRRNSRRFELIYSTLQRLKEGRPLQNLIDVERGY